MTRLVFLEIRPLAGRIMPIEPGSTIGRDGCDINLADPEVSRRHAVVGEARSAPAIEDLGSKNGTFVNGERIEGLRRLEPGDEIRFGNTLWRVAASDAPTTASPVDRPLGR
jgi:pSer/pThr/pTyr-binding forkhead associated (FHA) protein